MRRLRLWFVFVAFAVGGFLIAPTLAQQIEYFPSIQRITGTLLFVPDATYDIGATGANRPKDLFMSGALSVGGNATVGAIFTTSTGRWGSGTLGTMFSPANGNFVMQNNGSTIGSYFKTDALPVASSCGAGSPAVVAGSTSLSGSVTVGTGAPATCTITYGGTAFPSAPHCSGSVETTTAANARAMGYSSSTTVLTIVPATAWADSSVVNWTCLSSK